MRVAIYCRVSTEEQDPKKQELELKEYCERRKYDVVKVYTDVISGSTDSRPALNNLMIDAYNKVFDAVIIWKLDRLGRSIKHLIDSVNKFSLWGVELICTTQQIDTSTPNGKLLFHIFAAVGQFERDLISERTKLGMKRAKNVGKRGKDKRPRKRGGYFKRWSPKYQKEKQNKGAFI